MLSFLDSSLFYEAEILGKSEFSLATIRKHDILNKKARGKMDQQKCDEAKTQMTRLHKRIKIRGDISEL